MTRARDLASLHSSGFSGTELILDADGDTSITADTDDTIHFKIGGSDKFTIDPSGNVTALGTLPATQLTGTLPAIDGGSLTGITAGLTASAYSASGNGYITFSNGLMIQWARQGSLANGGIRTILFPITFPNAMFSFAASWTVMTSGTHHSAFPDGSMGTSSFGAYNVSGASQGVVFVATGR
tara:strand:- start:3573 stop:4118 length:546 start_codon:yes stop_codon:yes gene_type:complete